MHRALLRLRPGGKAAKQRLAQQRMNAIPGLGVVAADGRDKEVVRHHPRQALPDVCRVPGPTQDIRAQRHAEALADGHAGEHVEVFGGEVNQHLAFEEAGEGACVAQLRGGIGAGRRGGVAAGLPAAQAQG
ncbi:hypothetical protein D9M68_969230 [compost metagenome]